MRRELIQADIKSLPPAVIMGSKECDSGNSMTELRLGSGRPDLCRLLDRVPLAFSNYV
jgi:hypothetical protein